MNLADDVSRCAGRMEWGSGAKWIADCEHCARRTAPKGERIVWMTAPDQTPCPMRIDDGSEE